MKLKYEWLGPTTGGMLARGLEDNATKQLKLVVDEEGVVHAITMDQFKAYKGEGHASPEGEE